MQLQLLRKYYYCNKFSKYASDISWTYIYRRESNVINFEAIKNSAGICQFMRSFSLSHHFIPCLIMNRKDINKLIFTGHLSLLGCYGNFCGDAVPPTFSSFCNWIKRGDVNRGFLAPLALRSFPKQREFSPLSQLRSNFHANSVAKTVNRSQFYQDCPALEW